MHDSRISHAKAKQKIPIMKIGVYVLHMYMNVIQMFSGTEQNIKE